MYIVIVQAKWHSSRLITWIKTVTKCVSCIHLKKSWPKKSDAIIKSITFKVNYRKSLLLAYSDSCYHICLLKFFSFYWRFIVPENFFSFSNEPSAGVRCWSQTANKKVANFRTRGQEVIANYTYESSDGVVNSITQKCIQHYTDGS